LILAHEGCQEMGNIFFLSGTSARAEVTNFGIVVVIILFIIVVVVFGIVVVVLLH